jgi:hypothetical protein
LPDRSRWELIRFFHEGDKANQTKINVKRRKPKEKFSLTQVPFRYDSDDYYYLPGLFRKDSPGFLTPIFFKKSVLIKYANSPDYSITFGSKTYGEFRKGNDYGITFGINKNNKVIMWLGDVAGLPIKEQYHLLAENVQSDHSVGSDFYDGQIEAIFTEPTLEDSLMESRSKFGEDAFKQFGKRILHLDAEILRLIQNLCTPVAFTDKEIRHVIDILSKINVEALDSRQLGALIEDRGVSSKKLRSLKRLEKLYQLEFPQEPIADILSPLYVLYDLRIACSHLQSKGTYQERIQSVVDRLGIGRRAPGYDKVYTALLEQIIDCYEKLSALMRQR